MGKGGKHHQSALWLGQRNGQRQPDRQESTEQSEAEAAGQRADCFLQLGRLRGSEGSDVPETKAGLRFPYYLVLSSPLCVSLRVQRQVVGAFIQS